MNNKSGQIIDKVRRHVRRAFADVGYWESSTITETRKIQAKAQGAEFILGRPTNPEDRNDLCECFYMIPPTKIRYLLPVLLESVLDGFLEPDSNDDSLLECTMVIIGFLDVMSGLIPGLYEQNALKWGEENAQRRLSQSVNLYHGKLKQLSAINSLEAEAICEWLQLMETFIDKSIRSLYSYDPLEHALSYWRGRI